MIEMKDQKFGLELEFTGMTRERASKIVGQVVTGRYESQYVGGAYRAWQAVGEDGRKWKIMSDASISTYHGDACEFVTPILGYDDIPTLQEIIRALRKGGAKVNSSCGLHLHVDGANHNAKSLKNLLYTFRAKEDLIFKAVGTRTSRLGRWCKPIDDEIIGNVKKLRKVDDETLRETWYNTYAPYDSQSAHYNSSRYHALNFHSVWYRGTVEFRLFEATLHAGEIRAYINLVLAMSAQAINSKRASAEPLDNGNDKYAMRCWLLRLGFIGDEYKTVRQHLLKRLDGNAAWRNEPTTYDSYNNRNNRETA